MNKFEFYIPDGESIPTDLRLKKGNLDIYYRRDTNDSLTWCFDIYGVQSKEESEETINEIVSLMCDQSYDHGSEWRKVSAELRDSNGYGNFCSCDEWVVSFRIKDTW